MFLCFNRYMMDSRLEWPATLDVSALLAEGWALAGDDLAAQACDRV